MLYGGNDSLAVVIYALQLDSVALRIGLQQPIGRLQTRRDLPSTASLIEPSPTPSNAINSSRGDDAKLKTEFR